jgi:hypothetical protein
MLPQSIPTTKRYIDGSRLGAAMRFLRVLTDVANELRDRGVLIRRMLHDATFVMAKVAAEIGATKRGRHENHGDC